MDFGKRLREALKVSWIPIEVKFPEHEQVVLISAQNRPDTMIATYREDTEVVTWKNKVLDDFMKGAER